MGPFGERQAQDALRIALISEHASPLASTGAAKAEGQNLYIDEVARCMGRMGHQVDVYTRRDHANLPRMVQIEPNVQVRHIDAGPATYIAQQELLPHGPRFASGMRRAMSLQRPDVMHANFFLSGLTALSFKHAMKLPLVMTFHAMGLTRQQHEPALDAFPSERIDLERLLVREADAIVAECPEQQDDLACLYGADPARLRMVPCGIDTNEIHPMPRARARAELGLDAEDFIILQVGRLTPHKGTDNVIRALASLPSKLKVRLVVVGDDSHGGDADQPSEMRRLLDLAQSCGVAGRVSFAGYRQRSELRAYYSAANVLVTTPWYEPFGITPLEAMACAIPVIGSRVGGIQYSVLDGVTGMLVPPKDPGALARAIAHLQAKPDVARAMGLAGVRRVHSLFTWDRVATQLLDVYRSTQPTHACAGLLTQMRARLAALGAVSRRPGELIASLTSPHSLT